mgnify:CR=1 FL=1
MKKFLAMALAAVMVLALAACGSKNDTADDTGDAQDAQGGETQKLIVGFDAEFPPFGFIAADGTYDGFDLAMAKELCARLGWEYEAVAIDWNSKDAELSSGTINCIWNGFTYTGRENDYTFSDPYVDNSIVMVVKADSGITSLADLAGKSVMAQAASSAVDAINENEDFKASLKGVVELGDYNMGFMDLAQGTVDAVAADLGVAQYQIANNDGDYVILDEPLSTEQYAIGFLKGNTELRDAVNAELLKMAEDGTMLATGKQFASEEFCARPECHGGKSFDEITAGLWGFAGNDEKYNPHANHEDAALECGDCHKAHENQVLVCNECHDLTLPEGWEAPNAE